jgi:hypothetical protein
MRCPSCEKFVPLENGDLEIEIDVESDGEQGTVTGTVRVPRLCGECSDELKEGNFDVEATFDMPPGHGGDGHDLSIEYDGEEVTESGGGRYAKNLIGYLFTYHVTCSCQKAGAEPLVSGEVSDEMAASHFDELA